MENELINEVLDVQQRRNKARVLRRIKVKLQRGKARKAKRLADKDTLMKRARRAAIKIVRRRFAGKMGADYNKLPPSQKMQIDAKVATKKSIVDRIAMKLLPRVRQKEIDRFRARSSKKVTEEAETSIVAVVTKKPETETEEIKNAEKHFEKRKIHHVFNEERGAGEEGTDKLVNKYKKDTPLSEAIYTIAFPMQNEDVISEIVEGLKTNNIPVKGKTDKSVLVEIANDEELEVAHSVMDDFEFDSTIRFGG